MDTDDILSFSTPRAPQAQADVVVAPVLELSYCCYFLNRTDSEKRKHELPWLETIFTEHAELVKRIRAFWEDPKGKFGFDLFWMAGDLGYARDKDVKRFFKDLPELPAKFRVHIEAIRKEVEGRVDEPDQEHHLAMYDAVLERLKRIETPEAFAEFQDTLLKLWKVIEPFWLSEGQKEVKQAKKAFLKKFSETQSILKALPAHHFIQFENSAKEISASQDKGKLIIVPLYFSSAGGFNFEFEDIHYIGYGIQSEHLHEQLAQTVDDIAGKMKAVADPTRLMLLTLIAKYEPFPLTVGDLALQLAVSQPTVSGHLKILRETELIFLEKKGNKSFYKIDREAFERVMNALKELILS